MYIQLVILLISSKCYQSYTYEGNEGVREIVKQFYTQELIMSIMLVSLHSVVSLGNT